MVEHVESWHLPTQEEKRKMKDVTVKADALEKIFHSYHEVQSLYEAYANRAMSGQDVEYSRKRVIALADEASVYRNVIHALGIEEMYYDYIREKKK